MHPGGLWSKEDLVVEMESFTGSPIGRIAPVLRAGKIAAPEGAAQFPARMYATEDQAEELYIETPAGEQTSLDCDGKPLAEPTDVADV